MRIFLFALIGLFLILQYALWFSSGGLVQIWRLHHDIAIVQTQNAALAERNTVLQAEVNDLKLGNEALEERARNDLGMVKKNETFYEIVK
jgi:cell division protein FtsB